MNEQIKNQLAMESASQVHADWCIQELNNYFERVKSNFYGNNYGEALRKGCYKGVQERNEVQLDIGYLVSHETMVNGAFNDFNKFVQLINKGAINVKKFTPRNLTETEIAKAGSDYKNGEENILRPFEKLSANSQKENLDAAIGAVNVFVELSQAGVSITEMKNDPEINKLIGIAIHTDWLKRNLNHPNEDLKVPYEELDKWTQQQDLTVFSAVLDVVKKNPEKYFVLRVEGAFVPDYTEEERKLLGVSKTR